MPIRDEAARLASLANDYGPSRGVNAPASFSVHLFAGDPMLDGVEMSATTELDDLSIVANGYAPASLSNGAFTIGEDGAVALATFADALEEWPETATHWALKDPASGYWWDCSALREELDVTGASVGPVVDITVFYADSIEEPA